MEKVIHYCWFGGKPLPKTAKKCIKSWKKFLPDFEIIEWNEKNFDVNCCPFVKDAYEKKKWAFVSDYVRIYALYEYGGIYFDTDMEVLKDISFLFDKEVFFGKEDSGYLGTATIGVKEKHSKYMKEILKFYNGQERLNTENLFDFANPKIITNIFEEKYKKEIKKDKIEIYDGNIYVYPRDYFCPLNYNYSERVYTENTCMVHYFSATWVPRGEKIAVGVFRKFGVKRGQRILKFIYFFTGIKNRILYKFSCTKYKYKMKLSIHFNINRRVERVKKMLADLHGDYVTIYHPEWIGVSCATKDAFKYTLPLREQYTEKEAAKMAKAITDAGVKLVIFNAFAFGWGNVAKNIKKINKNIKIKILWHGSHALLSEYYDWEVIKSILDLYDKKIIDELGFVKKSLYEFYKAKGYKASFLMNTVNIENGEKYKTIDDENEVTKIGMYFSGERWVKNVYNQLSAISLIDNVRLDVLPLTQRIKDFTKIFKIKTQGYENNVSREEMFRKIAANDINVYVSFTECAPLIPLESLELGVPCITGDNHHYFEGTELEKYLVVAKEDNIMEIKKKIEFCLENKEKIMSLYKEWKSQYDIQVKESRRKFISE